MADVGIIAEKQMVIKVYSQSGWRCIVMFWPVDPAKNAIQGDAPEGSDTF